MKELQVVTAINNLIHIVKMGAMTSAKASLMGRELLDNAVKGGVINQEQAAILLVRLDG